MVRATVRVKVRVVGLFFSYIYFLCTKPFAAAILVAK